MVAIKRGATTKRPNKIKNWSFFRVSCFSPALDTDKPINIMDKGVVKLPRYCKSLARNAGSFICSITMTSPKMKPIRGGEKTFFTLVLRSN